MGSPWGTLVQIPEICGVLIPAPPSGEDGGGFRLIPGRGGGTTRWEAPSEREVRKRQTGEEQRQQQQQQKQQRRQKEDQAAKQAAKQQEQAAKQQQEEAARKRQEESQKKRKKSKGKKGMPFGMGPGETPRGGGGPDPSYDDIFGTGTDPRTIPTGRGGRSGGRGRPTGDSFRPGTDPYTIPHSKVSHSAPGRPAEGAVAPATNIFKSGPSAVEAAALQAKLEGPSRLSNPRPTKAELRAVTSGKMPFYRGGESALRRMAPAYFTSRESMAKFYGPVTEYRLKLRNPKFVTKTEWMGFDALFLRCDSSPVEDLIAGGYDSAVWVTKTPRGEKMFTVFALNGKAISTPSRLSNPEFEEDDEGYNLLGVSLVVANRICRRFLYANLKYDVFPEGLGESVEELIDSLPEDYAKRLVREGAEEMASYCRDRRASDYHGATPELRL